MLKLHGQFTREAAKVINDRLPSIKTEIKDGLLSDIVILSRMGLTPEGWQDGAPLSAPVPPPPAIAIPPISTEHSTVSLGSSGYKLSRASLDKLHPVIQPLADTVCLAIDYSLVDFGVGQAGRTYAQQVAAMKAGTTRTMKSKHLPDENGVVRAVDLWAYVNGKVTWDFEYYYYIARAMDRAATELGHANHIRWGCVWDRVLSDFGVTAANMTISDTAQKEVTRKLYLAAIEEYKKRHVGKDFLDGPHFEWVA